MIFNFFFMYYNFLADYGLHYEKFGPSTGNLNRGYKQFFFVQYFVLN